MTRRRWPPGDAYRWLAMVLRRGLTAAQLRVAEYLSWYRSRWPSSAPSRAQIAAATGVCERTVTRAVAALEGVGALRVYRDPPYKDAKGRFTRQRTNLYIPTWPPKGAKPEVALTGQACPVSAPVVAVGPVGDADDRSPTLFQPAPEPFAPPSPPPWVAEGVPLTEWLARQRR